METIFGASGGNQLKVIWSQSFDRTTRRTTVEITELWAHRTHTAWYVLGGNITLRDANGTGDASVAVALSFETPANNIVQTGSDEFKAVEQAGGGYTLGSVEVEHALTGEAAVEIGITELRYYTDASRAFLDAQIIEENLENHPSGLVRIDTGTEFKLAVPYIDNGSEWVQAIPYIDSGSAWTACG